MTFDKNRVLNEIQECLRAVRLPGSPGNPVSAGMVQRVIAHQGEVSIVLSFPPDLSKAKDEIRARVNDAVRGIDGVTSVQILEKAAPQSAPGSAAQPKPAGGAVTAQGVPGVRHAIAVASGKGGVGKSTIAVNLATALAADYRVGLLDADVYGPSIPKMLALEDERPEMLAGDRIRPLEKYGMKTMSIGFLLDDDSPVIWRGPMVTGLLRQFLFQVDWGELDFLVIDLPPGTGDAQLTLVQAITLAGGIIVTTPQDVALLDVRRGIQMFQKVEVPILGIVENMSVFVCPHCRHETQVFSSGGGARAAERYHVPFLGSIPLDAAYTTAGDAGKPTMIAAPESALAKTMRGVARAVAAAVRST